MSVEIQKPKKTPEKFNKTPEINPELDKLSREVLSDEVLSNIENKDFLKLDRNKRLAYISKWDSDYISRIKSFYEDIALWKIKDIEFTFTFWKKFNERLYLRTTAGQVLPPEVQTVITFDWHKWNRNWLYWEFFDDKWNRLIIWESTKIKVEKSLTNEEIKKQESEFKKESSKYWENSYLVNESLKRWLDPKISISLFWEKLKNLSENDRKLEIELLITELERVKDYFVDDFHINISKDWKINKELVAYFLNFLSYTQDEKIKIFKELWFDLEILERYKRKEIKWYNWETLSDEEKRKILESIKNIPEKFTKESFWVQFVPWSKEVQELFMYACNISLLPTEWASSEALHKLLQKESAWRVWVMNYEFKRSNIWEIGDFKDYVLKNKDQLSWAISKWLWTISNATWLWQMLISNVDVYYPEWRNGIWKPLNEAIWMLKYIKDRYWNPEKALVFHTEHNWY